MKIFIDTAPFIYLVEGHPEWADLTAALFNEYATSGHTFTTSVITSMEFGVAPYRQGRTDLIAAFDTLLQQLGFEITDINQQIAQTAARLRAIHTYLKGMDALQLAAALESGCDQFLTNDQKLSQFPDIRVRLLSDS